MCRLFGMTGGQTPVSATFWLLEAPDSLEAQSHREPDGAGLGVFDAAGRPVVHRWPLAAYRDRAFAQEARTVESTSFVAHVRFASTGAVEIRNTHPFTMDGRVFAHNGVVEGLDRLDDEIGDYARLVAGDTDSERVFALITRRTDEHGGDVTAGITSAVRWIADELPVFALNLVLGTADGLWALRYPDTHQLFVLERTAGGPHGGRHLEASSAAGRIRVRSHTLAQHAAVVVASERMDDNPGWRPLAPGELLHVAADLTTTSRVVVDGPPRHLLTMADLRPEAAASQTAAPAT